MGSEVKTDRSSPNPSDGDLTLSIHNLSPTDTSISPQKRREIHNALSNISRENEVKVIYAGESGSRAWGFESPDSDYDVRFIYVHPRDWYLTITPSRDVIERPITDELDISGWDIRKALQLISKSNPPVLEWLNSPCVYEEDQSIASSLRELAEESFSPAACFYHYRHMAQENFKKYLQDGEVLHKKYLYVIRSVLACRWVEKHGTLPPVDFNKLVDAMIEPGDTKNAITNLIAAKRLAMEPDKKARDPILDELINDELTSLSSVSLTARASRPPQSAFDTILRMAIDQFPLLR